MKNDKLLIKEVALARYGGVVDSLVKIEGNEYTLLHVADFTVERTITCVIDTNDNVAIDIKMGDVWNLIERDDDNRIVSELILNQLYPIVYNDKDWSRTNYLSQLALKGRAKNVYKHYLESKIQEQPSKQKIKKKEN